MSRGSAGFRNRLGRRGIAAVEFALVAPFMLILFMGVIEVSTLYRTQAKLNAVAFNVAQMVALTQTVTTGASQYSPGVSQTSLSDICQGAAMGMAPFPSQGMTLSIAGITEEASPGGTPNPAVAGQQNYDGATTNYDQWEWDGTVGANNTCATAVGSSSLLNAVGATAPVNIAKAATSAMLEVPCDNVVIVQASAQYPGVMGVILQNRPTLTQTAYVRWTNGTLLTELTCAGCTLVPSPPSATRICNSTNTLATN